MATRMKKVNVSEPVDVKEEIVEDVVEVKKKTFSPSDYILCHSITAGGLNITCQSGNYYEFKNYGDECEIEYRDLVALIRKRSEHIFKPTFVIDDSDFLEDFNQVRQLYISLFSDGDLKDILDLPIAQMTEAIKGLPEEIMSTLCSLAATEVADGRIDSVKKIKALTEIFGSDFDLLSQLFSR